MTDAAEQRARWETFAREDAPFYIDPTLSRGVSDREFVAGGRGIVEWALGWAGDTDPAGTALEIGCGIGRDTVHLAERFARVRGVDISPTMIDRARELGLPGNVELTVLEGDGGLGPFEDAAFAYAFSHLVFQHIADRRTIARYVTELARVLRPGAVAQVQFDTRAAHLPARLVQRLPDPLLPRLQRRGMRRHPLPSRWLRETAARAGLELVAERAPDSEQHWLLWRRSAA